MDEKKTIKSIATALVSQYGDDAQTVAMLRAAEFAAVLNNDAVSYTHLRAHET